MVALLLSVTVPAPALTKLLLTAPWKKNAPVLVTTPLKNVSGGHEHGGVIAEPAAETRARRCRWSTRPYR